MDIFLNAFNNVNSNLLDKYRDRERFEITNVSKFSEYNINKILNKYNFFILKKFNTYYRLYYFYEISRKSNLLISIYLEDDYFFISILIENNKKSTHNRYKVDQLNELFKFLKLLFSENINESNNIDLLSKYEYHPKKIIFSKMEDRVVNKLLSIYPFLKERNDIRSLFYTDKKEDLEIFAIPDDYYVVVYIPDIYTSKSIFYRVDQVKELLLILKLLIDNKINEGYDYSKLELEHVVIGTYKETPNGIIVNGRVDLSYKTGLTKIPWKFYKVSGKFDCSNSSLITLENSPEECKDFTCSDNKLKSLEFSPKIVHGNFNFSFNNVLSLKHLPKVEGSIHSLNNHNLDLLKIEFNFCDPPHDQKIIGFDKNEVNKLKRFSFLRFRNYGYSIREYKEEQVFIGYIYSIIYIYKLSDDYYLISINGKANYIDQYSSLLKYLKKVESLL